MHSKALRVLGGQGSRRSVVAKALEIGGFTEAHRAIPSPATGKHYQSRLEYELNHALTLAKQSGSIENPRHDYWQLPSDSG